MKVEDILSGGRKRRDWRHTRGKRVKGIELKKPIKLNALATLADVALNVSNLMANSPRFFL